MHTKVGEKSITKEGYEVEIVEYFNNKNITVKYTDVEGLFLFNKTYESFVKGRIKNPYHKTFLSVGYLGEGHYTTRVFNRKSNYYNYWKSMLERSYSKNIKDVQPSYKNVTVCEEWHNFQNFAQWFEENYNPEYMHGWHLDKDILVKGNKVYSPETCCFVPHEVNTLFTKKNVNRGEYPIGVTNSKWGLRAYVSINNKSTDLGSYRTPEEAFQAYKTAKEQYIKEVADKWKGLISDEVYQAMYNYQVEITD